MDHELKQRLIGAVVVTALCAIFIPMLFDDPVDNSGQLVSELSIPAPAGSGADSRAVPSNADQVLKTPEPEPLPAEAAAGDTIESTGAVEEAEEPEAGQPKQGGSGESLYAESEGYAREDAGAEEAVEQPVDEPEDNRPKSKPKQPPVAPLSPEVKAIPPKPQVKDVRVDASADEAAKIKKAVETVKPTLAKDAGTAAIGKEPIRQTVKKPGYEPSIPAKDTGNKISATSESAKLQEPPRQTVLKQPSTAKSLAAAVAEAKKPVVVPKEAPKLVRWYIQIGSFSKRENAMSLWESLREQGLPASLDTVQTDKGPSYRLRVGPELDGKKAAAMKLRLDKQNIKAILISE